MLALPTHPLIVHLPVVFVPLAAIGVIAIAVRPSWMRAYGPIVVGLAALGFVGSIIAASTGESLEESFEESGLTLSDTLQDHAEMGESVRIITGLFFLVVLAWVLFAWWRRRAGEEKVTTVVKKPRIVAVVLLVLAVVTGVAASASVYRTGHSGATSVWDEGE